MGCHGIPKYTRTIITGVSTALFQKIQRQDQWSKYHASSEVAKLVVNKMSTAYIAMPSSTYCMGRLRKTKDKVRG